MAKIKKSNYPSPRVGDTARHLATGTLYVIESMGTVKFNDNWFDSVNYRPLNPLQKDILYTRTKEEFQLKFEKLSP